MEHFSIKLTSNPEFLHILTILKKLPEILTYSHSDEAIKNE